MKAFTDIEQSKMLAAILPHETSDMYWSRCAITDFGDGELKVSYAAEPCNISQFKYTKDDIPCWSLAALIDLIQDDIRIEKHLFDQSDMFTHSIISDTFKIRTYEHDELIDACVEMILKLKDMNLL